MADSHSNSLTCEELSDDEIRNRDEFYQSLIDSRCLSSVSEDELTVELLRELCYRYALGQEWVKRAVISDAKPTNGESATESQLWEAYLFAVKFTADDVIGMKVSPDEEDKQLFRILTRSTYGPTLMAPVRGRQHVELKIIEDVFKLSLRCEQIFEAIDKDDMQEDQIGWPEGINESESISRSRSLGVSGSNLTRRRRSSESFRSPKLITLTSFSVIDDKSKEYENNRMSADVHPALSRNLRSKAGPSKDIFMVNAKGSNLSPSPRSKPFSLNPFRKSSTPVENKVELTQIIKPLSILVPEPYETRKLKVNDRLEKFVDYFVKEFEAKLVSYVMLSEGQEVVGERSTLYTRIGQVCGGVVFGAVGGVTGATLGLSGLKDGAEFGKKVGGKLANAVHSRFKTEKIKSLKFLIDHYRNQKSEFRRTLVEVGYDVFQSFEMQFMRVTSEKGQRSALHVLAIDLTDRIVDHVSRNEPEVKDNLHSLLIRGALLGRSKLNLSNLGRRGFEITYEYKLEITKLTTAAMWERAGVTEEGKFYGTKDGKSRTFGYRRPFSSENWTELSAELEVEVGVEEFREYEYVLSARKMKAKGKKMFQNFEENDLELERMEQIVRETKEEMMEGIIVLKGLSGGFQEDLRQLTRFQEKLEKIKIQDFTDKLEVYLNQEETKNAETEMLFERLNHLDEKFDEMDKKLNRLCAYLFEKSTESEPKTINTEQVSQNVS